MYSFFVLTLSEYTAKVIFLLLLHAYDAIVTMHPVPTAIGWVVSLVAGLITIGDKIKKRKNS
ncbi:hypothetical protein [Bacillus infantis]|uniref:hypothetical protein n=1 Tax=Bacillus infantis TaxID=324767 RepID=UPI003CEFEEB5